MVQIFKSQIQPDATCGEPLGGIAPVLERRMIIFLNPHSMAQSPWRLVSCFIVSMERLACEELKSNPEKYTNPGNDDHTRRAS